MPSGEASHIARKRASAAWSASSTRLRSTVRATPCATSWSRSRSPVPGRAHGGGEAGDPDQRAVDDHRRQHQRAVAVGRDQLSRPACQEVVGARDAHDAAAAQAGQERRRQHVQRHARELGTRFIGARAARATRA
jgi:hypothetical protein